MKIIRDNFNEKLNFPTFIVLGSFDGIHLGHRSLIKKSIEMAKKYNKRKEENSDFIKARTMVCTFENHPLTVINEDLAPKLVMDNNHKIEVLEKLGVDVINFITFNDDFMRISPEEFIKNLVERYNAVGIIVGFNYRFGYKNLGDVELLKKYSKILGFMLYIVKSVKLKDEVVSSSKIRTYVQEGEIEKANMMLGRPFMLSGQVVKGRQIGRTIGFPTINLDYDKKFVLPQGGVYYSLVRYKDKFYKAMTNVGYNPTVKGEKLCVETNIQDFHECIYGEYVEVFFLHKIREEKSFDSLEELVAQLNKDKKFVKNQNMPKIKV
ncbi:MAG: bifunctional riboflavin kinase/FAD synthetase [Clostridium argentinense]|nr:bifunctional riboflavin kinase/FAD synthetase [Clostridium argentinense]